MFLYFYFSRVFICILVQISILVLQCKTFLRCSFAHSVSVGTRTAACFSVTVFHRGKFSENSTLLCGCKQEAGVQRSNTDNYKLCSRSDTDLLHFQNKSCGFSCIIFFFFSNWLDDILELVPQTPHANFQSKFFSQLREFIHQKFFIWFLFSFFLILTFKQMFALEPQQDSSCLVRRCSSFSERCQAYWRLCTVTCLCFGSGRRWIHPHRVAASADEGNIPDNVECEQSARHGRYKKTWHNESDPEVYQLAAVLSK